MLARGIEDELSIGFLAGRPGWFDVTNRIQSERATAASDSAIVSFPLGVAWANTSSPTGVSRIYALASERAHAMIERRRWHELLDRIFGEAPQ